MSNVLGVIPARYASTRFPGKMLAPVCGLPLIQWVIKGAQKAKRLDALLVATDDERIAEAVIPLGIEAVMTQPDHPSGTDRIAEAVKEKGAGVIINMQGDEPLIDAALVDRVAELLSGDKAWDIATAAVPMTDTGDLENPSVVKVVTDYQDRALYFSRSIIPHARDGGVEGLLGTGLYRRHIGLYGYQSVFLKRLVQAPPCDIEQAEKLEQLRALYLGARMKVLPADHMGPGVDTPEDIPRAEQALRDAGLVGN